jgi:hypothetical protein
LGFAAVPVLIAACGGSSGNSSFVSNADAACATRASTVGTVYETTGEHYKPFTAPWAAGVAAGQAVARSQEVTSLRGIKPPSEQTTTYNNYVNNLQQQVTVLREEQAAATSGNQASYNTLDSRYSSLGNTADSLSTKLGLSACAGNGLTSSDKSQISHVISSTAVANSPSQCTQNFTLAFVKQNWGTMAGCVKNGKQPVGPNNPKSVDVSNIKGAGHFATADVVFHLPSGKKQNLSVALLNENGSWRLLGYQTR